MYNILVVDDDKEIVESIEIYLKNERKCLVNASTVKLSMGRGRCESTYILHASSKKSKYFAL